MSATKTTRAEVTPAYGMRPIGGYGIRGWRVYCGHCDHLGKLYENIRGCQRAARAHRCEDAQK